MLLLLSTFGIALSSQGPVRLALVPVFFVASIAWTCYEVHRDRRHQMHDLLGVVRADLGSKLLNLYGQVGRFCYDQLLSEVPAVAKDLELEARTRMTPWFEQCALGERIAEARAYRKGN